MEDEQEYSTPYAPQQAPSYASQIADYASSWPTISNLQQQQAGLDYSLYSQYAPQYTQDSYDALANIYPETMGLKEQLAKQVSEGMNSELPAWAKQQYLSDMNAGLGANANAPIGVSERSTGMLNLQKQWQDYYRNLGLSLTQGTSVSGVTQPTDTSSTVGTGINNAANYGMNAYNAYNNAFYQQPLIKQRTGGFSGSGALTGALAGSAYGPIGAIGGGLAGGFL